MPEMREENLLLDDGSQLPAEVCEVKFVSHLNNRRNNC